MDRMDDLIAFLRARLDDDEQTARAATDGPWTAWQKGSLHGLGDLLHAVTMPGQGPGDRALIVTASWLDAGHVARHDPARVLAEVEAKRLLLAEYADVVGNESADYEWAGGWASGLGKAVALLVLPYADHDDYQDTWRP